MKEKFKVFKFGGSSVKNAESIKNCISIVKKFTHHPLFIIVSAMGKTTDAFEEVVKLHYQNSNDSRDKLIDIKNFHLSAVQELFNGNPPNTLLERLNDAFVEIEWVLDEPPHENFDYLYDQIVGSGEILSSIIFGEYLNFSGLNTTWIDARDVILTDNIFREGWVQWPETIERFEQHVKPILEQSRLFITQGFIGSTSENFTTTLGREGSDYTAAIFSFLLDAQDMTIWKDVPGVFTADPRVFENVVKLDRLSYKEAIEMTYYGAKVIHPKTIKPLQNKSIPLYVRSFINPGDPGTCISDEQIESYPPMVAIEKNQALLQISTRDFSFVAEHHISILFQMIAELRLQVNMMQNSAISFSVCVNDVDDKVDRFAKLMEKDFKVVIERGLNLITIRHYDDEVIHHLKNGKMVLLEERIRKTFQMVVKEVAPLKWKSNGDAG